MALRDRLGPYGVWHLEDAVTPELAAGLEDAGYGAVWLGQAAPDLSGAERLLDATRTLVVATGIVNVWQAGAEVVAAGFHRVAARHPDRLVVGVGTGHPEAHRQYAAPYRTLADFTAALLTAGVPADRLVLAALGPRVLRLAADRTAGAHPYLVPVEHTRRARAAVGPGPLLVPEHAAVLDPDPASARARGRAGVDFPYLRLVNYRTNLRRLGWADADLADGGSDALVDALVAHGDAAAVAAGLAAHRAAGADHVAIQLLADDLLAGYRELAPALGLTGPAAG
ncbi:MAG: Coenzyme F420-dependent N5,N10-methylene tetrahydromethanopterin reductase and related flavin-dependent oxidoreductases [uncultured Corynebacteriales bacterium]|uniref:Coenzyme F420-dependent N5,N10-methylene tetrahydromethanopterin reductase and related flavin-dependent oxidoreductases n=1 Tax=uncultured Mycobacteriales bacterium TaxID=581187 RepID=A0A6J4JA29_9ACTN|nr:MAG: Coenzyme F420-dependent N5,N10-methylene tetrahydromethanopterin reductase and related flavin-dependent oxidoreductases [uncultured Corynebacteriales bacterium]